MVGLCACQHQACMAVLIQELITPEYSFILHTANPLDTRDAIHLYAEIAPGLGEVLAGGQTRGSPHRMLVNKTTGECLDHFSWWGRTELPRTTDTPR